MQKRSADWLLNIIGEEPSRLIGEVSDDDMKEIRARIKSARTIAPAIKKTFGLFL